MKLFLALTLMAFSLPVLAGPSVHQYEAVLDMAKLGIGSGSYRLEMEITAPVQPSSTTQKYVWRYTEPYGYSEYRCETAVGFSGGQARIRWMDLSTNEVSREYSAPMETGVSEFYQVRSAGSPCRLFWKNSFREETVVAPELETLEFNGKPLSFYFYGLKAEVRGRRVNSAYEIDQYRIKTEAPVGTLLIHYGTPYELVQEIPVVEVSKK